MAKQSWQPKVVIAVLTLAMGLTACSSDKKHSEKIKKGSNKSSGNNEGGKATPSGGETLRPSIADQIKIVVEEKAATAAGSTPAVQDSSDFGKVDEMVLSGDDGKGSDDDGKIRIYSEPRGGQSEIYAPTEQDPVLTGGVDVDGRQFTDGKNDVIMHRLVARMNQQIQTNGQQFFDDSVELATRLVNVDVSANVSSRQVDALIEFLDGPKNVKVVFKGKLNNNNLAALSQVVQPKDHGYLFRAYVTCIDTNRENCLNTIIVVEHIVDGEVCKRMFIVHRFGNSMVQMADADYDNFELYQNESQKAFLRYLANTAHFVRYMATCVHNQHALNPNSNDGTCEENQSAHSGAGIGFNGRLPRAEVTGYRSWAAAYGAAFFDFFIKESKRNGEPTDIMHIYGPLIYGSYDKPIANNSFRVDNNGYEYRDGSAIGSGIQRAWLVQNGGLGKLDLGFQFPGGAESYVDVLEDLGETLDPVEVTLYPGQPMGAAQEISSPKVEELNNEAQEKGTNPGTPGDEVVLGSGEDTENEEQVDTTTIPEG